MTEHRLRLTKPESGPNVIQRLEEALEMARNGHFSNVIIVATTTDGCVVKAWANHTYPFEMIGQMEVLKQDFINKAID